MCCGGRKSISPQAQTTTVVRPKAIRSAEMLRPKAVTSINRQYAVARQLCAKCKHPTMMVHIAGRERLQCTNINCRFIVR